jgi:hypothetical protein
LIEEVSYHAIEELGDIFAAGVESGLQHRAEDQAWVHRRQSEVSYTNKESKSKDGTSQMCGASMRHGCSLRACDSVLGTAGNNICCG